MHVEGEGYICKVRQVRHECIENQLQISSASSEKKNLSLLWINVVVLFGKKLHIFIINCD